MQIVLEHSEHYDHLEHLLTDVKLATGHYAEHVTSDGELVYVPKSSSHAGWLDGVEFHLAHPDASPAASHDHWLTAKEADGWTWGPRKNPETREHPCCVPFDQLSPEQRAKDYLFRGVVRALA